MLSVVVGTPVCNTLTNNYTATGTVSLTNATVGSLTITDNGTTVGIVSVTAGQTTASFSTSGVSGSTPPSHTLVATLTGGTSASTTYATPASCTVAPACLLSVSVSRTNCVPTDNTFASSVTVTITNPTPGTLTVTDGIRSQTIAIGANTNLATLNFGGLVSDGSVRAVVASLPSCGSATTTYSAPASCAVVPVCSVSATATASACAPASNTYAVSISVTVRNPTAGTLSVSTQGITQTLSTTTGTGQNTLNFTFNGLISNGQSYTAAVNLPGCSSTIVSYSAPANCSVAVCNLSLTTASLPAGQVGTPYSQTLATSGATGSTTFTLASGSLPAGLNLSATGIVSGTPSATGTAAFTAKVTDANGCTATAPLTITISPAPTSFCSFTVTPIVGACTTVASGTAVSSVFSSTVTVQFVPNTPAGSLQISDGASSTTIAVSANQTTATAVFANLTADGSTRTVTYSFISGVTDCGAFSLTYAAPQSCQPVPNNPTLTLNKFVDKSRAVVGSIVSYTLVLTNTGSVSAATTIRDSLSGGASYLGGSASAPAGTTFTAGSPVSLWTVGSIAPAQSLSLTFQANVNEAGIVYNKASIPGSTTSVCTSVPVQVCAGDVFEYEITAPPGRSSYRWYRSFNGTETELTSSTTNVLSVTAVGEYRLAVDNVSGLCPDFSCCPFVVEEAAPVASFSLVATPTESCSGAT